MEITSEQVSETFSAAFGEQTKLCNSCGAVYTAITWERLPLLGFQEVDEDLYVEFRNCPNCHSTLGWNEMNGAEKAKREGK